MKTRILLVLFSIGVCSGLLATEKSGYSQISFVFPGSGKSTVDREQFILVVVEGPYTTYDKVQIPEEGAVEYLNDILKSKEASYIGVHIREGVKYGDVIRALDILNKTNAKSIGVSIKELPPGRDP